MKTFFNVEDLGDLKAALAEAQEVKANRFGYQELGKNKTLLMIFFNNNSTGQITYGHYMIGSIHSPFFYSVNNRVHLSTTSIKIGGMNVDYEWLSAYLFCKYTRWKS